MSTDDSNKALVHRLIEEVWNQGKLSVFDELYAPEFVFHDPALPQVRTRVDDKQWIGQTLAAFPDFHITIEDVIADGDQVVVRLTARGTNTGEITVPMPHPATGKPVTMTGIAIARIANGQFVEIWHQVDWLGAYQQLDLVPAPREEGRPAVDLPESVRTYIDTFSRQDLDACLATFAPDGTYLDPGTIQPLTGQAITDHFGALFVGFPDATTETTAVHMVTDDLAVWHWVIRGTHTGTYRGIPPTGRTLVLPGCEFIAVRDGKLQRVEGYFDRLSILQQLGVMAAPAPVR